MQDISIRAELAFKDFWLRWGSRDEKTVSEMMSLIDEKFMGFGTNINEFWSSKKDLESQHSEERVQIPTPYNVDFQWVNPMVISDDSVLVCGEIVLTLKIKTKVIVLENLRNTLLFRFSGDKISLQHWHCSMPDLGISGEVVPGALEPRKYDEVSVFFCDFVGFTSIVAAIPADQLVAELNDIYQRFDEIMDEEKMEKIQVYGDGYLAVCGLPELMPDHAQRCILAAKKIFSFLEKRNKLSEIQWNARIGINTGPLVAGVIGERKFSFNIFGDTVNTAARLESASEPNKINISQKTYELVRNVYQCKYRGKIEAKGKGEIDMYFVD
ncbi:MAG: nuclear transport factor 2 family protein [Calditrichaeota bacterium]|nr:nuclear transport factor 2 family protein [Calditrichota bacterium]